MKPDDTQGRIAQLEAELQLARQRIALIGAVSSVVISRNSLDWQIQCLADLTQIFLNVDACVVRRLDGEELELLVAVGIPSSVILPHRFPMHEGIAGDITSKRVPIAIENVTQDQRTRPLLPIRPEEYRFMSYAGAPMLVEDKLVGVLGVYVQSEVRRFTDADLEHLQIIANHAASALENDRLVAELRREQGERLRSEQAHSRTEEIYRNVISAVGGVPYRRVWNQDEYNFWGVGITELTGYSPDELTQGVFASRVRNMEVLSPDPDPGSEGAREMEQQGTLSNWRADYLFEKKDGTQTWLGDASVPWRDEKGGLIGTVGILTDLNVRKKTEAALRDREVRLDAILDAQPDAVTLAGPDGVLVEINEAGIRLLGADGEPEVLGKSLFDYVAPEDRSRYIQFHRSVCAGHQGVQRFYLVPIRGKRRLAAAHSVPMSLGGSNTAGVLSVVRDITGQHEMEMRLRQSDKMDAIGQLAGGVAHDFNNILTGIVGFVELCIPNATGSLVEDFEEIRRLCDRGADLTRQLLAFSRRSVVAPSAVDLNRVVTETKRLLGRLLGEHIELTALLDPHVRCIRAEPSQVQQVIVNLAVNARDAMPLGGKLTIQTQVLNDPEEIARMVEKPSGPCYVMLAVSDTGQGISPEVRDRIFEPFFTTKPHGQGTGLGLATVYGIVKQSGGEISVQSKAGQGTTFHILFPVAVDGVEAVTPITSATEDSGGSETILVVEDDHLLRSLIRRILISRGYSVVAARNGAEALDVAANHPEPIQALVTDVIMPQMGGWELAQRLAMVTPDLRVLFISGYTTTEFSIERTVGAATAFIQKPFKPAELAGKVRAILDASKSA